MSNLDAAIRAHMGTVQWRIACLTSGSTKQADAAVRAVLDECEKCERGGTMMAPSIIRIMLATALGVDLPAEQTGGA